MSDSDIICKSSSPPLANIVFFGFHFYASPQVLECSERTWLLTQLAASNVPYNITALHWHASYQLISLFSKPSSSQNIPIHSVLKRGLDIQCLAIRSKCLLPSSTFPQWLYKLIILPRKLHQESQASLLTSLRIVSVHPLHHHALLMPSSLCSILCILCASSTAPHLAYMSINEAQSMPRQSQLVWFHRSPRHSAQHLQTSKLPAVLMSSNLAMHMNRRFPRIRMKFKAKFQNTY
ncbi:hypothetical protein SDJN02_15249, partial [Cucurbita argyrosperma subsp. argyrosperma]